MYLRINPAWESSQVKNTPRQVVKKQQGIIQNARDCTKHTYLGT